MVNKRKMSEVDLSAFTEEQLQAAHRLINSRNCMDYYHRHEEELRAKRRARYWEQKAGAPPKPRGRPRKNLPAPPSPQGPDPDTGKFRG